MEPLLLERAASVLDAVAFDLVLAGIYDFGDGAAEAKVLRAVSRRTLREGRLFAPISARSLCTPKGKMPPLRLSEPRVRYAIRRLVSFGLLIKLRFDRGEGAMLALHLPKIARDLLTHFLGTWELDNIPPEAVETQALADLIVLAYNIEPHWEVFFTAEALAGLGLSEYA
uniref:Uncharacterized protein n=1 Tax=Desulfacinum infernum TaxID=35837 RepID=A0A831ZXG7_9BACT